MRPTTSDGTDWREVATSFFVNAMWWHWLGEPSHAKVLLGYAIMNARALGYR
jgi:hypothetical protein